ncbi:MAG: hypothetical protein MRJ65_12890 [Candidatus Brocadiaceae bacterium]|nr:hypothetical protein [Candidatus Brocadiaceae bacterium]
MENIFDKENTINFLSTYLKHHERLLDQTYEIKDLLLDNVDEDLLGKKVKERGALVNRIMSSEQRYVSIAKSVNVYKGFVNDAAVKALFQKIQKLLKDILCLDKEVTALVKNNVDTIHANLEKIQDSRHFVNNLKQNGDTSPVFIDIRG